MWPTEFVWGDPLPSPTEWEGPGIAMFFNLECPACVSRGVPFLKRSMQGREDEFEVVMIHTAFGHKHYTREQVVPTLRRFAESFARLPFPVALDLDGRIAEHYRIGGTPHWLVFAPGGELLRSIYGSQDNAQNRLQYQLDELTPTL